MREEKRKDNNQNFNANNKFIYFSYQIEMMKILKDELNNRNSRHDERFLLTFNTDNSHPGAATGLGHLDCAPAHASALLHPNQS